MRSAPHNEAHGDFGLPRTPQSLKHLATAAAVGLMLYALAQQGRTQWLAHTLKYQPALGAPLLHVLGIPVYGLWKGAAWLELLGPAPAAQALLRSAAHWNLVATGLAVAIAIRVFLTARRRENNRTDEIHGSAKFADRSQIESAGLFSSDGVVLGKWIDRSSLRHVARYLRHKGPEHVLMFAPTGSGKGVGIVLPTLLTWRGSCLVHDLKGENYAKTSGWRKKIGQRVYKLDFGADPKATNAFNFLDTIRLTTDHEVADTQRLARMIVDTNGKRFEGEGAHWAETGSALIAGAMLHVMYREHLRDRTASLAHVLEELTSKSRNHQQVLEDWLHFPHDPKFDRHWLEGDAESATHPLVASTAREQLNRDEKERASVLSSAVSALSLYRDPILAANTSRSDFSLDEVMDGDVPITVYLVRRPEDLERQRVLVRMFLDVVLRRQMQAFELKDNGEVAEHKHKLLLMLDEFPALGRLDVFRSALAFIRGWGIRAMLICQDLEQLHSAYGRHETISSNCGAILAYAPNKLETAKHLSAMTGTMTVVKRARSASLSLGMFVAKRNNESEQEVARPLLTPDECMRLPGPTKRGDEITTPGDMLVFLAGRSPIYAQQPLYFRDPTLLARSKIAPAPPEPPRRQARPAPTPSQVRAPQETPQQASPRANTAPAELEHSNGEDKDKPPEVQPTHSERHVLDDDELLNIGFHRGEHDDAERVSTFDAALAGESFE